MEAFKADDIQPFVEMAYRFGPFFFAVLSMVAAFVMWRKAGGATTPVFFVSIGGVCIIASIYYWVNPPRAVYVYKITAIHDEQPGKTELNENTLLMTSESNDHVWTKVLPSIKGGLGFRTFTYEAVALKDGPFSAHDTFMVDLVWYPRSADPQALPAPQRDRLRLPYRGGSSGTYVIRRVEDDTTDAGAFYDVAPAEDLQVNAATLFIRSALADEKKSLDGLSREDLIKLLQQQEDTKFRGVQLTQEPIIVYYKKPSDKVDIEAALRKQGRAPQVETSALDRYPTNALWFGVDVPIEEAQNVAEILVRKGVALKYFGPFLREGAKANRIEIGTDPRIVNNDVMSLEMIREKAAEVASARRRS